MSHAAALPTGLPIDVPKPEHTTHAHPTAPVTPGKVAMWLFLATEIMFFTALIGTYIVLRAGSPAHAFSNLAAPGTPLKEMPVDDPALKMYTWPQPYDETTNPLSINLTAANTFVLICSSLTMVLALAAIQRGDKKKLQFWLLCTVIIGACFLSVQVFEYYELMYGRHFGPGISRTGHFRPGVSLFASCFFTMTGFHGAHVTGGVVLLLCIWVQSMRGVFTKDHHSSVEIAGLYWHFVDLVWIVLFTVVYLI